MNAKLLLAFPLIALAFAGCAELLGFNDDYRAPSGGSTCAPGTIQDCVAAAGSCNAGKQVCKADGTAFGECIAVLTPPEGAACTCTPGTTIPCYDGDPGTLGSAVCHAGTATCNASGTSFGACEGQVLCTGQLVWARMFGDPQAQKGVAIAADAEGNVIVAGSIMGTVPFGGDAGVSLPGSDGGADDDIIVLKLDPKGDVLWAKRFGDSADQSATNVAVDKDGNIVVVGIVSGTVNFGAGLLLPSPSPLSIDNDAFVLALNPEGQLRCGKRFGDNAPQYALGAAVDGSGNILVTGHFLGSVNFSADPMKVLPPAVNFDVFVAAFDPQCNHLWSRSFDGAASAFSFGVAADEGGNAWVLGEFGLTIDIDGTPRPAIGPSDAFIAKLDAKDGGTVGVNSFGGPGAFVGTNSIAFDPKSQHVVFSGIFRGEIDIGANHLTSGGPASNIYLAALDSMTGKTIAFATTFGDGMEQSSGGIALDGDGNIVLSANVSGTVNFGGKDLDGGVQDKAVAKFDQNGKHLFSRRFGGNVVCSGGEACHDIAVDKGGNILLTGGYKGASDFGGGKLLMPMPKGQADIAVAKLSP